MRTINFTLNIPKELTLVNLCTGLVHHASEFESNVTIQVEGSNLSTKIDLKSILGVMSLVYSNGKKVIIEISGEDEDNACECISKYVERLSL